MNKRLDVIMAVNIQVFRSWKSARHSEMLVSYHSPHDVMPQKTLI